MRLALLFVASCSFIAAKHPNHGNEPCMPSRTAPIVETVIVAPAATADVLAATCKETSREPDAFGSCGFGDIAAAGLTIIAVPALISALYGYAADLCPAYDAPVP